MSSVESKDIFDIDFLDSALDQFKEKQTPFRKIRKVAIESDYYKRTQSTEVTTNAVSRESVPQDLYNQKIL